MCSQIGYLRFGQHRPVPWRQAPGCSAWQWLLQLDWPAAAVVQTWGDRKAHHWCPGKVGHPREVGLKLHHTPPSAVDGSTLEKREGKEEGGAVNLHTTVAMDKSVAGSHWT